MLEITIPEFVWWVLCVSGGLVLLATFISRVYRSGSERRARSRRIICRLCLHAFEEASREKTLSCPACGALNRRRPPH